MGRLTKRDFIFDSHYVASHLQSWSIAECLKKLQEYENAEEDGKLLILPCKVGDTAWFVRKNGGRHNIIETSIEKIVLKYGGLYIKLACNAMYETSCNSIGKTVFFHLDRGDKDGK